MEKTKAQMNWEVGKEQEEEFLKIIGTIGFDVEEAKQLFTQIRQNEYRRAKEDTLKEIERIIDWTYRDLDMGKTISIFYERIKENIKYRIESSSKKGESK